MTDVERQAILTALTARRSANARQMTLPAPDEAALGAIAVAGAAAPDHGLLAPFRFVALGPAIRETLAEALEQTLIARDSQASAQDRQKARDKVLLGPAAIGLVAKLRPDHPRIILSDQWLTLGGALQNMVLAAEAMGYGVAIRSGRDFSARRVSETLGLTEGEEFVAMLAIGSVAEKPPARMKPALADVFRTLA